MSQSFLAPLKLARTAHLDTSKQGYATLQQIEDYCRQVRAIGGFNTTQVVVDNNGLGVGILFDPS